MMDTKHGHARGEPTPKSHVPSCKPPPAANLRADINWRFLQQMRSKFGDDWQRIAQLSIIEEGPTGEK